MGHTERVILVKGDSTKWYNQAIFIVNKEIPAAKMPVDFVAEAEKIIYNHVVKGKNRDVYVSPAPMATPSAAPAKKPKPKASAFDFMLNIVMLMACVAIIAVFAYGMMA